MSDYECDLLIRGAEVFDGSGGAPFAADVAVAGDRIVAVGPGLTLKAREVIAAEGLALAPGFIDVHTHDDMAVMAYDTSLPKLSQGVTTVVTGNCGISLGPTPLGRRDTPVPPLDLIATAEEYRYATFGDFLTALRDCGPAVNVVPLVGHTVLRARAVDDLTGPASAEETEAMRRDVIAALEQGAAGLSTGLAYPPAKGATTDEVLALVREVASFDAIWTTHMRDERTGVVSAVAETIDIARRSGARTLISHHKCCGEAAFGLSRTTLAMIEEARREIRLDIDVYPYTASSTVLIESFAKDSRKVTVSWSDPHPEMAGRDLDEITADWGIAPMEALARLRPGGAIYHQMDDGDLERILAWPPSLVGSDGLPRDRRPHPRLWGAFPRVLGHYARDQALLTMSAAIAKMTGQTADVLNLPDRGRIAAGAAADLVLFDTSRIRDAASFDEPTLPADGIRAVLVNGTLAYEPDISGATQAGRILSPTGAP
ncbi:N-acyl-D-amino-acid deacylase family protein [Antarctobacter heliothermus]|uniref:N-acyl-D-amino-acid deacylase n=1 Tax=Antarctobacter heliothermus TaxID=74033 RepID=A0A239BIS7_9RHOB|nr:D-aminoacylase [Antarctobacter heliothermus]SNS07331.1 N-acyl-D-amino-acid deacylase [Antarctobacter heliothermus]